MKKTIFYILAFVLAFQFSTKAQKRSYPLKNLSEYKSCNGKYDNWLKNRGLSQILSVNKIDIYDNQLALYLKINGENEKDKLSKWKSLIKHYRENKSFAIYEELYKNMIYIYEISPDKANIQIWEGEYYYMIYYDEKTKKITFEENKLKSKIEYIDINLNKTNSLTYNIQDKSLNIEECKKSIYKKILHFSEKYFRNKVANFENDFTKDRISETRPFVLTVNNMRAEVLYDSENSLICDMMNWFRKQDEELDCRPREWLKIEFTAEIQPKKSNSDQYKANIKCEITGKYAPHTGKNNPEYYNDMEADYSYYLVNYTTKLTQKIEEYLNKH